MTRTIQQLFDLSGKTALVTGGSRGLGLQMAHALGEAGANIVLSSRKAEDLEEAAAELKAAGIKASWIAADCAREEDIRRLATETLAQAGQVDILVNNAGAAWGAPAEDHPVEAWDKVMNLNIRGYFILSQHIAKHSMIPRQNGRIINVFAVVVPIKLTVEFLVGHAIHNDTEFAQPMGRFLVSILGDQIVGHSGNHTGKLTHGLCVGVDTMIWLSMITTRCPIRHDLTKI